MVFKTFLITFCLFLPFTVQGASLIDINTAPLEELEKIIGIGPVLAQRIIEARPFSSLDDLIKVKGIGEITLQKIKDQALAWVGPQEELEPEGTPKKDNEPAVDDSRQQNQQAYPTGIVFNEILPSPEGADAKEEWLELKNTNKQEVDISDWKIQDTVGSTKAYIFPKETKIKANDYLVLARPISKITLNNSGDGLELIQPDGNLLDNVIYEKAILGQSYNRMESGWEWSTILTPGTKNVIPPPSQSTPTKSSTEEIKRPENESQKISDVVNIDLSREKSKPPIWLIALVVAVFSGIAIVIVKNSQFLR